MSNKKTRNEEVMWGIIFAEDGFQYWKVGYESDDHVADDMLGTLAEEILYQKAMEIIEAEDKAATFLTSRQIIIT